MESVDHSPLH